MATAATDIAVAKSLICDALDRHRSGYGAGSMSCSLYDTAWVACVSRKTRAYDLWAFPQSFLYIVNAQRPDGRWFEPESSRRTGGILSSLASLYALIQHTQRPLQIRLAPEELANRTKNAIAALSVDIQAWDIRHAREVGFEILVPAMLDLLERDGIILEFSRRCALNRVREKKLSKLKPEILYSKRSTLLHSLEAFVGDATLDFDKIGVHKTGGSIMASPAATAAYLIRSSQWDPEADAYLQLVISNSAGQGSGAVPSAYPTTNFELIWMASTLLMAGITAADLGTSLAADLREFLHEARDAETCLFGFAPGLEPDLDDSAKASVILSLLGAPGLSGAMTTAFGSDNHFKTYAAERNPSLSANANLLHAMALDALAGQCHHADILKAARFVCKSWLSSDSLPQDKWNISPHYSSMLVAHGLCTLLRAWDESAISGLDESWLRSEVLVVLVQCLTRTLLAQRPDGSWGGPEETSYALITLHELSSLPQAEQFHKQIENALGKGRPALNAAPVVPESLWIEKVMYHPSQITKTYIAAARLTSSTKPGLGARVRSLYTDKTSKFVELAAKLPMFASTPRWVLDASWMEAQLFLPRLHQIRSSVFVREGMSKDKYFEMIPFTWCAANNVNGNFVSSKFLFDMMTISVFNYQVDEFMEAVIGAQFRDRRDEIETSISQTVAEEIFRIEHHSPDVLSNGNTVNGHNGNGQVSSEYSAHHTTKFDEAVPADSSIANTTTLKANAEEKAFRQAIDSLRSFIRHSTRHPHVETAHEADKVALAKAIEVFLFAHIVQTEESTTFKTNNESNSNGAAGTFDDASYDLKPWIRTTAADHTSCSYSFALMTCLGGADRGDGTRFWGSAQQRYVADDLCRHLAAMCRLYNDLGSLQRDRAEWNLNVANLPEMHEGLAPDGADGGLDEALKSRIYALAEYERQCMNLAKETLAGGLEEDAQRLLDVFVSVTDMFGQIYVVKDMASRRTS